MKRDNTTLQLKTALRRAVIARINDPAIMETHGGWGEIFNRCYANVRRGVVFEKDDQKAEWLCRPRPTWAVYESCCVRAIAAGAGAHLEINLLDVDPYGNPWPVIEAFFASERPFADEMWIVATDGNMLALRRDRGFKMASMQEQVIEFGSELHRHYMDVWRRIIATHGARAGYSLRKFSGYVCGYNNGMVHCCAMLRRGQAAAGGQGHRDAVEPALDSDILAGDAAAGHA
jgi:hypothetical protein